MQGNDVRELQRDLVWLGFDIVTPEIANGRFGETTRAAVRTFQTENRLERSGVVDAKTVEVINEKLRGLKRVVRGNLLQMDGKPLEGARVRAFDKGLRAETKLGEATPDAAGYFEISYVFGTPDRVAPNLVVKGFASARRVKPIAVSPTTFDADPELIINLLAGGGEFRGLSEFERLMKDLNPLVEEQQLKIGELLEDEENHDVSFLSNQTRHSADRIAHAVLAHRYAERNGLEPEVSYAFLRHGLPPEPSALLSQDPSILRRALVQAVADNVIPQGFETEAKLEATVESLKAWRAGVALEEPPDPKQMTLGTLVKKVLREKPQQERFMRAFAEHSGSVDEFWDALARDTQLGSRAAELKFAVLLGNLGQNHLPLIDAVRTTSGLKELKDLASLSDEGWHALITERRVGTPPGVEGADDAEKTRRYARYLANAVEALVPTEFFVARLKETEVEGKDDLLKFFQANPTFDIKETRLEAYLKERPEALNRLADKAAAVKQLKGLQRIYRIAPGFKPAMALQQAGKDSAHRISRLGQNAFVASYGQHFADAAEAKQVYAKARHASAAAVALIADVSPAMNRVAMHAVPDTVAREVEEIPEWSTLFGSVDFCSCDHCQSVHGPAAYLVDLLNFLKERSAWFPEATPSVKDVLFKRRPDLGEIELTCENTNTAMPYVDLVLELLEDAVAPQPAFNPFDLDSSQIADLDRGKVSPDLVTAFGNNVLEQASVRVKRAGEWWMVDTPSFSYSIRKQSNGKPRVESRTRQTSGTQGERAASSQYINRAAYTTLKEASFPWSIPCDFDLEEVRACLGHLGVPRYQVMEVFLPGKRSDILSDISIAVEYLGLSTKSAELICGTDPTQLWIQWGFKQEAEVNGATWLDELKALHEFLRRSGLGYDELLNLLETRYVNSARSLAIVSNDVDQPDTCDPRKLELTGLNAGIASRILRFVRLSRVLGWSIFELDRTISALGGDLTVDFLVRLAHLSRLRTQFNLPVTPLLALWAPLDNARYTNHSDPRKPAVPSLYDQLFRSRASVDPVDPAFTEDPAEMTGTLTDHGETIAAALEISAADLNAIRQSAKVFPPGNGMDLNLANLSRLFRHVTLARALELRVEDYLRAVALIDETLFTGTDSKRTILFVEEVMRVRDSRFSFAELDYLLNHRSAAASGIELEESIIVIRLKEIRKELQQGASGGVVARKLGQFLRFETQTMSLLKPQWTSLVHSDLADPEKDLTKSNFPLQFRDLIRLHKLSVIAARFQFKAEMLDWLLSHGPALGLFDLTDLPATPTAADFAKWMRVVDLLTLRPIFSKRETGLVELLELAHRVPAPGQDELLNKLVDVTNWNRTDLDFLVTANGFDMTLPASFESEQALVKLRDSFAVLKRLGISADDARNLSVPDVDGRMARAVKQAVRAKYDEAQWLAVAKPLRDVLREKQRAALVAYLVNQFEVSLTQLETPHPDLKFNDKRPAVRELQRKLNAAGADPQLTVDGEFRQATQDAVVEFQNRHGIADHSVVGSTTWAALDMVRLTLRNANDLYSHFLIDVEMDPCMMTSRIKQAISSVQLFVQRCLMSLEADVIASSETDDAWDWWKWMKNYRVWEANCKVFLYPENWIEPELRDDKSPFFKQLESELLESDLTLESAETAFLNYLEKLDQIARLETMGLYHQKEAERDILHVFARTQAPPRVYYYRQRVNGAYWTPWEKVDLDIDGNHLIPVVWNSRLFLFWPIFIEKADPSKVTIPPLGGGGTVKDQTRKYWDMNLAWSERKQGKWTSKKMSSQSAKIEQLTSPRGGKEDGQLADSSKIYFIPRVGGDDLSIDQFFVTTRTELKRGAFSTLARPANPVMPESGDDIVHPGNLHDPLFDPISEDGAEGTVESFVVGSHNRFFFQGCYFDPKVTPRGFSGIDMVPNSLPSTSRSYMSFVEVGDTSLNLPVHQSLDESRAALAQTAGTHRVTSQGSDFHVTRNPFLFEDALRNYLVIPKRSWWDDIVVDPSELGGIVVRDRALSAPAPPPTPRSRRPVPVRSRMGAWVGSPGLGSDIGLAALPEALLGPVTHVVTPFIRRPNTKYSFLTLYHPYFCAFISLLNRHGLAHLLRRETQLEPHRFFAGAAATTHFSFEEVYGPLPALIAEPHPTEEIDFSFSGSYASYNWELFFHAPLLIADRLSKNQRFEEATRWFHYIFNPTDTSSNPAPARFWQTKEFFEKTPENYQQNRLASLFRLLAKAEELRQTTEPTAEQQEELRRLDDLEASIKTWREQPFKPHVIARMRTTAYQKAVVMKYIDNLIAWGDQLFRRDTLETINEATQLYVLAAEILGTRPVEMPPRLTPRVQTYNSLEPKLNDFVSALVEVEGFVPVETDPGGSVPEQQPPSMLYFCVPKNDKLLRYWDTVADRMFKIRHCMNIEGVVRQLPLFEPPIDPGLFVRGVAAGLDPNSLLNDVDALLPAYRFNVLAQKATELCGELRSLGATLLATLEKRDAEELSLLRTKHETGVLAMLEQVKEKQLDETAEQLRVLSASRDVIVGRLGHYQRLLGDNNPKTPGVGERIQERDRPRFSEIQNLAGIKMFPHEVLENTLLGVASGFETLAATQEFLGAVLELIPDGNLMFMGVGVTISGIADAQRAGATGNRGLASVAHSGADMTARLGSYVARELDWVLQHNQAAREIMQIDRQIVAAEIRREIARHELRIHRGQMENAAEVEEFMRDKYTNEELYSWMVGQMSGVYFQAYQLAYETARRAEKCYQYELGIPASTFVQFGYWDSLKKGLLAGDKLYHALKRMEMAYLDQNTREYELTKSISLALLDPIALINLKETGECFVNLPEETFDFDYPGHYFRRIKSVRLTVPCVTGPHTTINCTLTLLTNSVRTESTVTAGADGYRRAPNGETRFRDNVGSTQSIATSSGQSDGGVFELNFRDERYLPFEGAGVISSWRIELTKDKALRPFDYGTISDVIIQMSYTAKEGGEQLKAAATTSLKNTLKQGVLALAESRLGLYQLFSARQEFSSEWHRFFHPTGAGTPHRLQMTINQERFPFIFRERDLAIASAVLFLKLKSAAPSGFTLPFTFSINGVSLNDAESKPPSFDLNQKDIPVEVFSNGLNLGNWEIEMTTPVLDDNQIEDVWFAVNYKVSFPS
jgi:peptidoglycan hydrolase-like protein with peptidoglycan-binding domain